MPPVSNTCGDAIFSSQKHGNTHSLAISRLTIAPAVTSHPAPNYNVTYRSCKISGRLYKSGDGSHLNCVSSVISMGSFILINVNMWALCIHDSAITSIQFLY